MSVEDVPGSEWLFSLNMSMGMTAAALIVVRIFWRLRHTPAA
jgi:cytochrome b561